MLHRFRNAVSNVMGAAHPHDNGKESVEELQLKYPYGRPIFLELSEDEIQVTAEHASRPIVVPRDRTKLPWNSGYSEVINAGKSKNNEDQACAKTMFLREQENEVLENGDCHIKEGNNNQEILTDDKIGTSTKSSKELEFEALKKDSLPYTYFAVFDGHAGTGAAIMAVNHLHNIIQEKLYQARDMIIATRNGMEKPPPQEGNAGSLLNLVHKVPLDGLVTGALESAFHDMDDLIDKERKQYKIIGGCTAIVALFFCGKLYVANAGDCRAVLCRGEEIEALSQDFTPETERLRIQQLALQRPELMGNSYIPNQYARRVLRSDFGKPILYRSGFMTGWGYKIADDDDTKKVPIVYGVGKRARLMETIGVTRGFGDHDIKGYLSSVQIKPFLTSMPEVKVYDMSKHDHTEDDFIILASDGLWDVLSNEEAVNIVRKCLKLFEPDDISRYTSAAQELVINARGMLKKTWKMSDDRPASADDISVFVIPLHKYTYNASQSSSTESSLDRNPGSVAI